MAVRFASVACVTSLLALPSAWAQGRGCAASQDLTVQALEKVSAGSPPAEITAAVDLLKRAAQVCASNGDAWYYRSVMEGELHHDREAGFALSRAKLVGSAAMEDGRSPFQLATPPANQVPVTTPPERTQPAPAQGAKWALVIGVGRFQDSNIESLKYTAADASLFAATLQDPTLGAFAADHIRLLLDGAATTKEIKANLNWIARQAQPEDTVVVYVATHGSARDLDEVGGVNYLITADTEVGPDSDQDALFGSALPMIELIDTVATRIRALRTAIFIDTCYSGSVKAGDLKPRANALNTHMLDQMRQGSGRIIITASRDDQESQQSDQLHHGYFTYFLVQALRTQRNSTLADLFPKVRQDVSTHVADDLKAYHLTQTPVFSRSSESTDFALNASALTSMLAPVKAQ